MATDPIRPLYWILDDHGEPIPADTLTWAAWFEQTPAARQLAYERVGDAQISTVFIGLDMGMGLQSIPRLWETAVFGGDLAGMVQRYPTRDAALAGHADIVQQIQAIADKERRSDD